ncbi:AraC family transcriptional regulator [Variovorax paradoxus]|jgi:AraC-like DNA-binding protein|uniref:AraC-like ligand-binding domain-containing protein n=1 Tax=Variovorax TaxID=34072 RepID=UPI0006E4C16B|nr:helix-turn-helix domain-containing protein [Variovorax sp. CY25R-8]KPU90775.1 AraC family transcriptional regulator [Variovorax paradoxus]KPV00683.1 AraC family transcriptional regulator [Variovorax paradoxus]KPV01599.1 AraC family transcriptional regulator [Variovorax paradoxus]KPV16986.1 AraC family transcriptional regulator [Variovorax paradoxus]KPV28162.1 AraC family transcriptional regulator [Variovorax paradoxus]
MNTLLSTDAVARPQRLAYWTDMICNVYVQLGCDPVRPDESEDFEGSIRQHTLPGLDVSVVRSGPQKVLRTSGHIARSGDDYFLVSIQAQGRGVVRQDGRDAVLEAGDFALYDSTRPYQLLFDDRFEQIVLKLPGDRLRSELRETQALTATTVSGRQGAGHLLLGMIRTLREDIETLQPASALAVANGVQNILVAGLQTLPAASAPSLSSLTAYHLARVKRRIEEQLGDPALSVGSLAAELGVSASQIHRVFKSEPLTPAQYIWERRLEACSRDLLEPRLAGRPVAEIAYGRGFNDAAHFSRAFKERFGCSPREWRQQRVQ